MEKEPPTCMYVTFDPESTKYPFDIAQFESERISFTLEEAKVLRRELGQMIKWYEAKKAEEE